MALEPTWTIKQVDTGLAAQLEESLGLRRSTAICLINRGIDSPEGALRWMNPRLSDLELPEGIPDLPKAAERIAAAVMRKERIGVFGDYDVDGITSASVVSLFLRSVRVQVETSIADRFTGYGMSPQAVEAFVAKGCTLILAVDLGTSDHAAAARAKELGIEMIVIDHHSVEGEFPDVFAFVNPKRKDCAFTDQTLAAVGLSFYSMAAVRTELCNRGYLRKEDSDMRPLLDLVALGTVADVMPLRGNNRILVYHGLKCLSDSPRIGIRKLMRIARIRSARIRSEHIAYQLAPRLNAAGRIGRAEEAYLLLTAGDAAQAERLAARLDQLSMERRRLESEVLEAARRQLIEEGNDAPVTIVAGDGWHRGVLGIVASRLVEETCKPAFVVGFDGDEGIGSVRGRGQLNVYDALAHAAEHLARFGGHREAAGFTVLRENFLRFRVALSEFAASADTFAEPEPLACDDRLRASEIDGELVAEIERIGPFGPGNSEPLFDIDGLYILEQKVIGQDHLKLELKTPSGRVSAFGPRMAALAGRLPPLIRTAAHVTFDEWRGNGEPELRLAAPPIPGS